MKRKFIAGIILLVPFSYIYGLSLLSLFMDGQPQVTPSLLFISLIINLLVMGGTSMLCVGVLYGGGVGGIFHNLYFRKKGALRSAIAGVFAAVAFLILLSLVIFVFQSAGYGMENEMAEEIAESMTLPLLFAVPILSALSEEMFFRAFLQMRMAKYGQPFAVVTSSLLFGIAHLSYGNLLQIAVPFAFGIVLGYLMVKNENIIAPFFAHFTFNFIQLAFS